MNILYCAIFKCRPHSTSGCHQIGHVENGAHGFGHSGPCPGGVQWSRNGILVNVKVQSNDEAQIFVENRLINTVKPHFPVNPIGGILAANGYKNIAIGTSFNIQSL